MARKHNLLSASVSSYFSNTISNCSKVLCRTTRPQAKHASYIAIKSRAGYGIFSGTRILFRRALPLFKYHGAILCPTSVLTMPSYASMHAFPTRTLCKMRMQMRKSASTQESTLAAGLSGDFPFFFFFPIRASLTMKRGQYFPGHQLRSLRSLLFYQEMRIQVEFHSPPIFVSPPSPPSRSSTSRNGNVPRAMKMIKRHPESRQSRSNPAPKAKSETPAVL